MCPDLVFKQNWCLEAQKWSVQMFRNIKNKYYGSQWSWFVLHVHKAPQGTIYKRPFISLNKASNSTKRTKYQDLQSVQTLTRCIFCWIWTSSKENELFENSMTFQLILPTFLLNSPNWIPSMIFLKITMVQDLCTNHKSNYPCILSKVNFMPLWCHVD